MLFHLQRKEAKKKRRTDSSSRPVPLIYIFFKNIRHFLKNSTVVDRLEIQNKLALQLGRFKAKNIGKLKTDLKAEFKTTSGFMLQQFLWNIFGKHIIISIKNLIPEIWTNNEWSSCEKSGVVLISFAFAKIIYHQSNSPCSCTATCKCMELEVFFFFSKPVY